MFSVNLLVFLRFSQHFRWRGGTDIKTPLNTTTTQAEELLHQPSDSPDGGAPAAAHNRGHKEAERPVWHFYLHHSAAWLHKREISVLSKVALRLDTPTSVRPVIM